MIHSFDLKQVFGFHLLLIWDGFHFLSNPPSRWDVVCRGAATGLRALGERGIQDANRENKMCSAISLMSVNKSYPPRCHKKAIFLPIPYVTVYISHFLNHSRGNIEPYIRPSRLPSQKRKETRRPISGVADDLEYIRAHDVHLYWKWFDMPGTFKTWMQRKYICCPAL